MRLSRFDIIMHHQRCSLLLTSFYNFRFRKDTILITSTEFTLQTTKQKVKGHTEMTRSSLTCMLTCCFIISSSQKQITVRKSAISHRTTRVLIISFLVSKSQLSRVVLQTLHMLSFNVSKILCLNTILRVRIWFSSQLTANQSLQLRHISLKPCFSESKFTAVAIISPVIILFL